MFRYCKIVYKDSFPMGCEIILIEIDQNNNPIRSVSVLADGTMGYATSELAYNAFLPETTIPTKEEFYCSGVYDTDIADFFDISQDEFNNAWDKAINSKQ